MTRTNKRERLLLSEQDICEEPSALERPGVRKALSFALVLTIILYGLFCTIALVALNLVPVAWSWIVPIALYAPFVVLYNCDSDCRDRKNADGTTTRRTGWPFRIALLGACAPPIIGVCSFFGMVAANVLQMNSESGYVISAGLFVACVLYAIHLYRDING